jgi:hypothetical protein
MPCEECGASLDRHEREDHTCDSDRRLEYEIFQQRAAIAHFDDELGAFLISPRGQFELWYAEYTRERGPR